DIKKQNANGTGRGYLESMRLSARIVIVADKQPTTVMGDRNAGALASTQPLVQMRGERLFPGCQGEYLEPFPYIGRQITDFTAGGVFGLHGRCGTGIRPEIHHKLRALNQSKV